MTERTWLVGSLPDCDLRVESSVVSGKHCRLTARGEGFLLEDLHSTNGTFIDDERIHGQCLIWRGDRVTLGGSIPLPWPAPSSAVTVGRAPDNDIVIPYDAVSGHHARVEREGGQTFLVDLNSTNGTALNDPMNKITRAPLTPTDFVFLGTHRIAAVNLLAALPPERPQQQTQLEVDQHQESTSEQSTDDRAAATALTEESPSWAKSMHSRRSWLIGIAASIVVAVIILGSAQALHRGETTSAISPKLDASTVRVNSVLPPHQQKKVPESPSHRDRPRDAATSAPGLAAAKSMDTSQHVAEHSTSDKSTAVGRTDDVARAPAESPSHTKKSHPEDNDVERAEADRRPVRATSDQEKQIGKTQDQVKKAASAQLEIAQATPVTSAQVAGGAADAPPKFPVGKKVDLLRLIDPKRDSTVIKWTLENNELVSPKEPDTLLRIPVVPPPAYRLTVAGQRDEGDDLFVGLVVNGQQVVVMIDAWGKRICGLSCVNEKLAAENATRRDFEDILGDKQTYTVMCEVYPGSVVVMVNGMPAVEWIGESKELSLPRYFRISPGENLFLGANNTVQRIRQITLEALPEAPDVKAALEREGIVKLAYQQPLVTPSVGWDKFRVNWIFPDDWPLAITADTKLCNEFIYAHAPSKLVYELPKGGSTVPRRFTAVGYSMDKQRYRIFASDKQGENLRLVFESDPCRIANINASFEPADRYVLMQIEGKEAPAFWLHPTIFRAKRAIPLAGRVRATPEWVEVKNNRNNDRLGVNAVPKSVLPPLDVDEEQHCDEFLFAHAPSEVDYEIPSGAVSFSAIGYCLRSGSVEFQVRVDNLPNPIFRTGKTALVPITVEIPRGAEKLRLSVSELGNGSSDWSFWLYPRFQLATKKARSDKPTDR